MTTHPEQPALQSSLNSELKTLAFALLEKILKLLTTTGQIPATQYAQLEGKTIRIIITDLDLQIALLFDNTQIILFENLSDPVDTTITMDVHSLSELARNRGGITPSNINMEIRGNMDIGQQFRQLLDETEIDGEEILSTVVGDVLAYKTGQVARSTQRWLKTGFDNLSHSMANFLVEEKRFVVHPVEIDEFITEIDTIRLAVERIEARVNRLKTVFKENKRSD